MTLDGFSRTTIQAKAPDAMLAERGERVTGAISMEIDDVAMVTRIAGRFTCGSCDEGYHDTFKPTAAPGV